MIKIGVLTDMSGPNSDLAGAGSMLAARIAAEDKGKLVGGRKIEVISADHQNKADIASSIASRWFDTEGAYVIVDVPFSSAALAVQSPAESKGPWDYYKLLATIPADQAKPRAALKERPLAPNPE